MPNVSLPATSQTLWRSRSAVWHIVNQCCGAAWSGGCHAPWVTAVFRGNPDGVWPSSGKYAWLATPLYRSSCSKTLLQFCAGRPDGQKWSWRSWFEMAFLQCLTNTSGSTVLTEVTYVPASSAAQLFEFGQSAIHSYVVPMTGMFRASPHSLRQTALVYLITYPAAFHCG